MSGEIANDFELEDRTPASQPTSMEVETVLVSNSPFPTFRRFDCLVETGLLGLLIVLCATLGILGINRAASDINTLMAVLGCAFSSFLVLVAVIGAISLVSCACCSNFYRRA